MIACLSMPEGNPSWGWMMSLDDLRWKSIALISCLIHTPRLWSPRIVINPDKKKMGNQKVFLTAIEINYSILLISASFHYQIPFDILSEKKVQSNARISCSKIWLKISMKSSLRGVLRSCNKTDLSCHINSGRARLGSRSLRFLNLMSRFLIAFGRNSLHEVLADSFWQSIITHLIISSFLFYWKSLFSKKLKLSQEMRNFIQMIL